MSKLKSADSTDAPLTLTLALTCVLTAATAATHWGKKPKHHGGKREEKHDVQQPEDKQTQTADEIYSGCFIPISFFPKQFCGSSLNSSSFFLQALRTDGRIKATEPPAGPREFQSGKTPGKTGKWRVEWSSSDERSLIKTPRFQKDFEMSRIFKGLNKSKFSIILEATKLILKNRGLIISKSGEQIRRHLGLGSTFTASDHKTEGKNVRVKKLKLSSRKKRIS